MKPRLEAEVHMRVIATGTLARLEQERELAQVDT